MTQHVGTHPRSAQTRTIYRRACRGGVIKLSALGMRFVLTLVVQIALARILIPHEFGRYALCVLGAELLIALTNLQLGNYFIQLRDERPGPHLVPLLLLQAITSLAVFGGAWFAAGPVLALLGGEGLLGSFRLILFGLLLVPLSLVLRSAFERDLRFGRSTIPGVISLPVQAIVAIPLALRGHGEVALIAGYLAKEGVEMVILFALSFRKLVSERPEFRIGPALRFSAPLVLTSLLVFIYWHADDGLVAAWLGEATLGQYYVAFKFPHFLFSLNTPLVVIALSVFSRLGDNVEDLGEAFEAITAISGYLFLAMGSIGIVAAEPFIRCVLGETWLPARLPMQIFFGLIALRCPLSYWSALYQSRGITRQHVWPTLLSCVVVVAGGVAVLPRGGITGMALVVLAAILFNLLVLVPRFVSRFLPETSLPHLLLRPLGLAVANLVVFGLVRLVVAPSTPWTLALAVGTVVVIDLVIVVLLERNRLLLLGRWLLA